jgi:hypothetical protein
MAVAAVPAGSTAQAAAAERGLIVAAGNLIAISLEI